METQDGLQHEDKCRVWDDPEFCDCGAREVDRLEKERDKYRHDYLMLEKSWQELDKENARLLQSALASQRDADKLLEKLHAAERGREQLAADVAYLADRASAAGRFGGRTPRDYGISSNAIVAYAYGGAVPSESYMPCDKSDLAACELAVARMPEHRKTPDVLAALERAKKAVRR